MDFNIQVAHSVTELGEEAWNYLKRGPGFVQLPLVPLWRGSLIDCPPTYIVLSLGSEPVACARLLVKRREWLSSLRGFCDLEQRNSCIAGRFFVRGT